MAWRAPQVRWQRPQVAGQNPQKPWRNPQVPWQPDYGTRHAADGCETRYHRIGKWENKRNKKGFGGGFIASPHTPARMYRFPPDRQWNLQLMLLSIAANGLRTGGL